MSRQRTEADQRRTNLLKVIRTAVRLKHSLAADDELNVVIPEAEKRFNAALNRGRLLEPGEIKKSLGL